MKALHSFRDNHESLRYNIAFPIFILFGTSCYELLNRIDGNGNQGGDGKAF